MQLILNDEKLKEALQDIWLVSMALAVFEDFVKNVSAEDFATKFGTKGTETISQYFIKGEN